MTANLVWITPEAEKVVMYCARVSSDNQTSSDTRLLSYCIKHSHWSVFESANMCIEIVTSRAISAQIIRHRSFSFQEFSQRYAKATYTIKYGARRQDEKNRQNSLDDLSGDDQDWWEACQKDTHQRALVMYNAALDRGIAKECARMVLPMATATTLYMNGTVRSWIHYLNSRCDVSTQLEHREIANQAKNIFIEELPIISKALGWVKL